MSERDRSSKEVSTRWSEPTIDDVHPEYVGAEKISPDYDGVYKSQPDISSFHLEQLQLQLKTQQDLLEKRFLTETANQHTSSNTWSFTQGLMIGQASVILVIIIFVKFFVFADASPASTQSSLKDSPSVIVKNANKAKKEGAEGTNEEEDDNMSKISGILEKTYYDVNNHASESLDWFNVLIAQTISQLRTEALLSDNIYHSLNEFLTKSDFPEYLDKVKLTEIDIGDDFPIFSNCRIKHSKDGSGRLEAKIDVDLSDTLTLGIETRLLLNHPRPLTAVLPVELSVSIVRFSGCLTVSLINTNDLDNSSESKAEGPSSSADATEEPRGSAKKKKGDNTNAGTALMFSFAPDYRLEFTVKSLIGSRAKLQDVPKISSLIESKLRSWFIERCIEPRFQVVKLPSLWPRRKNTREPVHSNVNGIVDKTEEVAL